MKASRSLSSVSSTSIRRAIPVITVFILRLDKPISHGLTLLASYTACKEIDDSAEHFSGRSSVANPYNMRQSRALADYDVPQRLVISYIWQMPFGPGQAHFNRGLLPTLDTCSTCSELQRTTASAEASTKS